MIEAFRLTAAAHPDRVAARTPDDACRTPSPSCASGRSGWPRGCTASACGAATRSGSCSSTGPSSMSSTSPRCTSARRRSRSTTPPRRSRSSTSSATPATRIALTERQFVERVLAARDAGTPLETIILLDAEPGESLPGRRHLARAGRGGRRRGLRPRGVGRRGRARGRADADLHLRHDRPAEGCDAHAREPARDDRRHAPRLPVAGRRAAGVSFLPSAHIADRWGFHYSALMTYGYTITTCADPKQLMQIVGQVQADVLRRRPADLGEAQGGLEAMVAGAGGSGGQGEDGGRDRRRRSRRCASSRPASRCRTSWPPASRQADEQLFAPLRAGARASRTCSGASSAPRPRRSRCSSSSPRSASRRARSGG